MGVIVGIRRDWFPWAGSVVLFALASSIYIWCYLMPQTVTTIYVIRHAERADASNASPLSPAGQARAEALVHVLGLATINAIFVTNTIRSQQTAAPLAAHFGLSPITYDQTDAQSLASDILVAHSGQGILVVAHSETVDDVTGALGAAGVAQLPGSSFDRMFVIHRFGNFVHLDQLRYGLETP
jgi:broad specificity phosphatase PhoE